MNSKVSRNQQYTEQPELSCPLCGDSGVETLLTPYEFIYGSEESAVELKVEVPMRSCKLCDFYYLDEEGEQIKHHAVCQHLGVLSPIEILKIRKNFGLTRTKFAELTGIGEASLHRWENGLSVQRYAYDRYLRLLDSPEIKYRLEEVGNSISQSRNETPLFT